MIWVEPAARGAPERVHVRSAAGLEAARYLGGPWRLAVVFRLVPAVLRDAIYDLIARRRHRLAWEPAECFAPPPSVRARFSA